MNNFWFDGNGKCSNGVQKTLNFANGTLINSNCCDEANNLKFCPTDQTV